MNTHRIALTTTLALAVLLGACSPMFAKPNVVLIVCDDLNDFVTGMDGHSQARTERWRYIRYNNGAEELYDHANDPYEWTNLATIPEHAATVAEMKRRLPDCVPR